MKQTEIGLLPEDWEVVKLSEVLKFGSGRDYKHLKKGDIPVYGTGGLMTLVNDFLYDGNSVGIGRKGTIDKPVFLTGKFWTVDTLFFTHSFQKTTAKYIYYQFGRIPWKEYNEASGVPSLNKNTLEQIQIPLPPLPEQEAIAEALSDADAWIESLEQLIAKKRLIKQGAMQELLTPKEDWEVKKLGEITIDGGLIRGPFGGALKKEFFVKNGYKVYEQKNAIYKSVHLGKYFVDTAKFKELGRFEIKANDFILSCSGTIGKLFRIPQIFQKGIINQALLIIRLNPTIIDFGYFGHIFQYDKIQSKIIDDTQGGAMKNLVGMSEFRNTEIPLPSLTEQTRIATILSDMDAELEALERQLTKARQVKGGMMQELLTGRVRLV
ncbi:restriction endonuclease subunit S [Flavobacterium selenitireducens]|uniref:restriction endonuclease subunit S n=1 Tax=Flavobacterium selenitireducens TaxID=2722704 RepID=UPI00168AA217|nr:restriction endonuclease subunit S [Flavobacterium selenitireducens]